MHQVKGTDTALRMGFEDSYAAKPVSPVGYVMPYDTCAITATRGKTDNNTILNTRAKGKPGLGNLDVGGNVVAVLAPQSAGPWLKALFGTHVKTGASAPYTHDFTVAKDVPSFWLEKDYGTALGSDQFEYFGGCKVNSMQFQIAQEGLQKITVDVKGATQEFAGASADADADDYRVDTAWDGINVFITEGGSQVGIVSSGTLTISNNLDESSGYTIPKESEKEKAGTRQFLKAGQSTVSATLTVLFTDAAFLKKGLDNSESSLEIKFSRGSGDGSTGNESLSITLPKTVYEAVGAEISGPAGTQLSVNLQSFGDTATATLKNSEDL